MMYVYVGRGKKKNDRIQVSPHGHSIIYDICAYITPATHRTRYLAEAGVPYDYVPAPVGVARRDTDSLVPRFFTQVLTPFGCPQK